MFSEWLSSVLSVLSVQPWCSVCGRRACPAGVAVTIAYYHSVRNVFNACAYLYPQRVGLLVLFYPGLV